MRASSTLPWLAPAGSPPLSPSRMIAESVVCVSLLVKHRQVKCDWSTQFSYQVMSLFSLTFRECPSTKPHSSSRFAKDLKFQVQANTHAELLLPGRPVPFQGHVDSETRAKSFVWGVEHSGNFPSPAPVILITNFSNRILAI